MKQVKLAIYKRITMPWILSNTTMQTPTLFFSPVLSRIRPVGRFYMEILGDCEQFGHMSEREIKNCLFLDSPSAHPMLQNTHITVVIKR